MTDISNLNALGQTFGTWGSVVIFTLYLIYQSIRDFYKSKKESIKNMESVEFKKQVAKQMGDNYKTNQEMLKYLKISTQKYMDEISETQTRILIDSIFDSSQNKILLYMTKVIQENSLHGNERETTAKIKAFISNRHHQDFIYLKEFQYNGVCISEYMDEAWKESLSETITGIILNEKGEKALASTIQNVYEGFKCQIFDKLF